MVLRVGLMCVCNYHIARTRDLVSFTARMICVRLSYPGRCVKDLYTQDDICRDLNRGRLWGT